MKVIVTGAGGQLGRELQLTAPVGVGCLALSRGDLDIGDATAVSRCLEKEKPQVLINAAAYTAVDRAESEPAAAARVNVQGAANLATACQQTGCRLLHVSTDFVFDGNRGQPYPPAAAAEPLGEYGRTKLLGEAEVARLAPGTLILRTGWVYSRFGGNFVNTMLRLMAQRQELAVVCDQVGTPTWARGLAEALWTCAMRPAVTGIYHWSDAGVCSWYDFAVAISEEAGACGLLERPVRVRPISAAEYPTPARRPAYSVLDKSDTWRELGVDPVHWRVHLRAMLRELPGVES